MAVPVYGFPKAGPKMHFDRMRLSVKGNECLLALHINGSHGYQGVLFTETENGTRVYEMKSELDEDQAHDYGNQCVPLQVASLLILTYSLGGNTFGTFELEFSDKDENEQLESVQQMHNWIGNVHGFESRLSIDRLVVNSKVHASVISSLKALLFNFKGKVCVDIEDARFDTSNCVPFVVYEKLLELTENGDMLRTATYLTSCDIETLTALALDAKCLTSMRYPRIFDVNWSKLPYPIERVNENVLMKRWIDLEKGLVYRYCKSDCGFWVHCIKQEGEMKYEKFFKNETCGIGYFCDKCSDKFNRLYYKHLFTRLHHEPEWVGAAWRPEEKEKAVEFDKKLEIMKEKMRLALEEANRKMQEADSKRESKPKPESEPKPESKPEPKPDIRKCLAHVRLSISEKKCLFLKYQDIHEFTKQTFSETSKGVIVTHVENSSEEKSFTIPKMTLLELVCRTVKTALSNHRIETFELEFSEKDQKKQEDLVKEIEKQLEKAKGSQNVFHAKTLVTNWIIHEDVVALIRQSLFKVDEIQNVESIMLSIGGESLVPMVAYDTLHKISKRGDMDRSSVISNAGHQGLKNLKNLAIESDGVTTLRLADSSTKWFDEQVVSSVSLNPEVEMKRFVDKTRKLVTRFNKSSCGIWIHCVKLENEKKFEEFFKKETCGLRHFCQKCSSQFDYWFYQNLPRRVYNQPEWCDVLWYPEDKVSEHEKDVEQLRKKFEEEMAKKREEQEKRRHWSSMRAEDKKEVVKRLDLMSRHAMRCVSKADREVVDSTELYVPRVRFSIKDDRAMVMVYTGIDKFLRVEINQGDEGVLIHKMENTYNLHKASVKFIRSGILPTAMAILQPLFIHKSVLLGTLEIETVERHVPTQYAIFAMLLRCLRTHWCPGNVFRAKRFIVNYVIGDKLRDLMVKELLDATVLEVVETEQLDLDTESTVILQSYYKQNVSRELGGVRTYHSKHTTINHKEDPFERLLEMNELDPTGYATVCFADFKEFTMPKEFERVDNKLVLVKSDTETLSAFRKGSGPTLARLYNKETDMIVRLDYREACGGWRIHLMKKDQEKKFKRVFESETCERRFYCEKCCDPFDNWFYWNITQRVYHEPDWFDIQFIPGDYHRVKQANEKSNKLIREHIYKTVLRERMSTEPELMKAKPGAGESWGFTKMIDKDVDSEISSCDEDEE